MTKMFTKIALVTLLTVFQIAAFAQSQWYSSWEIAASSLTNGRVQIDVDINGNATKTLTMSVTFSKPDPAEDITFSFGRVAENYSPLTGTVLTDDFITITAADFGNNAVKTFSYDIEVQAGSSTPKQLRDKDQIFLAINVPGTFWAPDKIYTVAITTLPTAGLVPPSNNRTAAIYTDPTYPNTLRYSFTDTNKSEDAYVFEYSNASGKYSAVVSTGVGEPTHKDLKGTDPTIWAIRGRSYLGSGARYSAYSNWTVGTVGCPTINTALDYASPFENTNIQINGNIQVSNTSLTGNSVLTASGTITFSNVTIPYGVTFSARAQPCVSQSASSSRVAESSMLAESPTSAAAVAVYPNPVKKTATVYFSEPIIAGASVALINKNGQPLKTYDLAVGTTEFQIDISSLPADTYYLQTIYTGVKTLTRIIKE